jgi:hypothetical protein
MQVLRDQSPRKGEAAVNVAECTFWGVADRATHDLHKDTVPPQRIAVGGRGVLEKQRVCPGTELLNIIRNGSSTAAGVRYHRSYSTRYTDSVYGSSVLGHERGRGVGLAAFRTKTTLETAKDVGGELSGRVVVSQVGYHGHLP